MSDTVSEHIKIRCPVCSKKLAFPSKAIGRKAERPACAHVFRVSNDAPAPAAKASEASAEAGGSGSLFEALAAAEQAAERVELSEEEAARARLASEVALAAQGAALAGSPPEEVAPSKKFWDRASKAERSRRDLDGSFFGRDGAMLALVRGILFSIVGALVADAVWLGIVKALSGYSPGFMPLIVGMGAALGMTLGIRSETKLGGILAVVITWVGIAVGQVAIVIVVLFPKAVEQAKVVEDSIKFQRSVVLQHEIDKAFANANVPPEELSPSMAKEIENRGKRVFGAYTDDQIRAEYKKIQAAAGNVPPPQPVIDAFELLIATSFSYLTLLSSIGALVIAFFVGSGILSLGIE